MLEIWDLYDELKNKIDKKQVRGTPLSEGEYHLVTEVWITNSNNQILLTQRHPLKSWGNYWECPGGAVLSNETSLEGICRELREETGITLSGKQLSYLGMVRYKDWITDSFRLQLDMPLKDLVLQECEVRDARWVDVGEFGRMSMKNLIVPYTAQRFELYGIGKD